MIFIFISTYLIEIGNYFIQQPQAFQTLIRSIHLCVELVKVRHRCEYDTNFGITLMIEFLWGIDL